MCSGVITCDEVPMFDVSTDPNMQYDKLARMTLLDRAAAACNTALLLTEYGLDLRVDTGAKDEAARLVAEYAENPESTTTAVNNTALTSLRPASLILVDQILNEFGHSVAENATTIRNLVTNKLLLEVENPDPRIRLRALELLGKSSDVGLFTEKSEVTIKNKTSDDIRDRLRSKLSKLSGDMHTAEDAVVIEGKPINVDAAFGLVDE